MFSLHVVEEVDSLSEKLIAFLAEVVLPWALISTSSRAQVLLCPSVKVLDMETPRDHDTMII